MPASSGIFLVVWIFLRKKIIINRIHRSVAVLKRTQLINVIEFASKSMKKISEQLVNTFLMSNPFLHASGLGIFT